MTEIREIARRAHAGQVDRAGRDYFDAHLIPIAEAASLFGWDAEAAGWLHDVIEDTKVTLPQLSRWGVRDTVVGAIDSVTRRSDESYDELITRAAAHPLGRLVKLADNAWNITSNPGLAAIDPGKAASLLEERYFPARERLLSAAGFTETSDEILRLQHILDRHHQRLLLE
ncbi:MAG: phosphohydrolase [Tessaracoccus sp.]